MVGKPGVGKTAIVEHLAWLIENGKCAEGLKGKTILTLSVNDIIAGTTLRGMAEERFKNVSDFLENVDDVILFIDEIHNVLGAGNSGAEENKMDFANALKTILAREGCAVIGATTEKEYDRFFEKDDAFKRRFEKIIVREPKPEDVYEMIREQVNRLKLYHHVNIPKNVVKFIINVSGCFIFETSNPDRTIDLIDKSMVATVLAGKNVVTKKIVMSIFDTNFELFKKMSYKQKLVTAYHEVGHYLVARYREEYSKRVMCISIIPTDEALGLTVYVDEPNIIEWTYDAHLHNIAIALAGRVSEKMYTGKDTSGARRDLKEATEEAKIMVLEDGLYSNFSKRNCQENLDEKRRKELNDAIDRVIESAYARAEKILEEHNELREVLAETLVKKGILTESEIDKICKKVEKGVPIKTKKTSK